MWRDTRGNSRNVPTGLNGCFDRTKEHLCWGINCSAAGLCVLFMCVYNVGCVTLAAVWPDNRSISGAGRCPSRWRRPTRSRQRVTLTARRRMSRFIYTESTAKCQRKSASEEEEGFDDAINSRKLYREQMWMCTFWGSTLSWCTHTPLLKKQNSSFAWLAFLFCTLKDGKAGSFLTLPVSLPVATVHWNLPTHSAVLSGLKSHSDL